MDWGAPVMVTGIGDYGSTPGTPSDSSYHYVCPSSDCPRHEWTQTQLANADLSFCGRHKVRFAVCTESGCARGGRQHLVP
jgi:hypothetical protein